LKSLVVFYSRTGNARWVAQTIAAQIGADIEEVIDQKKRDGALAYLTGGSDARRGKGTEIAPIQKSPADYDLIIVGTPIWAGRPTPAITTYLKKNSLSGKKVAVFFVQGGKNMSQGVEQTKALLANCEYMGNLSLVNASKDKEGSEKQIIDWCKILATA
jgi:flavodoxin